MNETRKYMRHYGPGGQAIFAVKLDATGAVLEASSSLKHSRVTLDNLDLWPFTNNPAAVADLNNPIYDYEVVAFENCPDCGALVMEDQPAPDLADDLEWSEMAKQHAPLCEWIKSRGTFGETEF